ncbi:MAG: type IV toxin-antitoxin system AbiEi family antitoxin domain-containing protein [Oscillospiraceae bacterium]|nr:type IV toxin-antitoxin system AbiEi family antitoxin domain-containing protein [Oscillospiraceae bacterium]
MDNAEKVLALMKQNNGYLSSKEAKQNDIENKVLQRMAERGIIERVAHGLYTEAGIFSDSFFVAQHRVPKGIFSHETALFLHDLSDRNPLRLMMTIPAGWNSKLLTDNTMFFFYNRPKRLALGACEIKTPFGMQVSAYDVERTICDCLKYIDKLDRDLVLTALKRYLKSEQRDNAKLLEYATALKIRDEVYRYMEVLI